MTNPKMQRAAALAYTFETELGDHVDVQEHSTRAEVYVNVHDPDSAFTMGEMDKACTIAYDHGFTPNGLTQGGAVRFRPRADSEVC